MKTKNKIAYVLDIFPKLSETFILNEILELENNGLDISIFSLSKPNENIMHHEAKGLAKRTFYLNDGIISKREKIRGLIYLLSNSPLRALKTYYFVRRKRDKQIEWNLKQSLCLAMKMKKAGIKHIHAHFAATASEYAMLISMLTGIPYSFTAHAYDIFIDPRVLKDKMNKAKFVVTVCEYNKEYLLEFNRDFEKNKLHIVICGINPQDFSRIKTQYGETRNDHMLNIISIGRLVEKKGFQYLVKALSTLSTKGLNFRCIIVGEGPEKSHIANLIKDCQQEDLVLLKGGMNKQSIKKLLSLSDLFVLPCVIAKNGDRDSMPVVIKEAMAMELPIISTDILGIPEMVKNGAGILVEPGNSEVLAEAIEKLYNMGKEEREMMGKKAREIVEVEFDLGGQVKNLANLFSA